MGRREIDPDMRSRETIAVLLLLVALPALAQEDFPAVLLTSHPSEVKARVGDVVALTITISNGGSGAALNTFLQLAAAGCLEVSIDGLAWRRNMSIRLGDLPARSSLRQLVFLRSCGQGNATLIITAFADNHDPVLLHVAVYYAQAEESSGLQLTHLAVAALAAVVLALVAFFHAKRKTKQRRKANRGKSRARL